jgi:dienelactone hydrolase
VLAWFVEHGYVVVLPIRRGYGATGGERADHGGDCEQFGPRGAANAVAEDIKATIDFMTRQPFVEGSGVVVVGNSFGGFGTIGLARHNDPRVKALINFAGVVPCGPAKLAQAAEEIGGSARQPMLWIYSENDPHLTPDFFRHMADAYKAGGAPLEFHMVPPFQENGHMLFNRPMGRPIWGPIVETFLAGVDAKAATSVTQPSASDTNMREEVVHVPMQGTPGGLAMRICRPDGELPAPLAVINHGNPPSRIARRKLKPHACNEVARFFTTRGYVVAFPLRRGYGDTGGRFAEGYSCDHPDYVKAGLAAASDIAAAIQYLKSLPYVAKDSTVVVGQSAGGWGTIALASLNPDGVGRFINFAGGRGGRQEGNPGDANKKCSPSALIAAAGAFGRSARRPMLWIYTENDSFFDPKTSQSMFAAFKEAGGTAEFRLLPPFGRDGHALFERGPDVWAPIVDRWLSNDAAR